jgi:hypothetical protein
MMGVEADSRGRAGVLQEIGCRAGASDTVVELGGGLRRCWQKRNGWNGSTAKTSLDPCTHSHVPFAPFE